MGLFTNNIRRGEGVSKDKGVHGIHLRRRTLRSEYSSVQSWYSSDFYTLFFEKAGFSFLDEKIPNETKMKKGLESRIGIQICCVLHFYCFAIYANIDLFVDVQCTSCFVGRSLFSLISSSLCVFRFSSQYFLICSS
jgi:hypothetical protein